MKTLVLHYSSKNNENLSYQHGWVKALKKDPNFECEDINLYNYFIKKKDIFSLKGFNFLRNISYVKKLLSNNFDIIIILHSAFSNACHVPKFIQNIISLKKSYKIYFIGNEYKLMPEKIKFTKDLKIDLFVTQSLSKSIIELYKNELKCDVIGLPGGGLDTDIFYPKKEFHKRSIDIGYRAYDEPLYFGHQERFQLMQKSKEILSKTNLKHDLSMNESDRFVNENWSNFINECKSFIGTNTGYDYFELTDEIRNEVNVYLNSFKKLNNQQLYEKAYKKSFINRKKTNSMRLISGRNIEVAGCKTLQLLVDGDYGGYFMPDVHYIKINKDYSNLEECFEKLSDKNFCEKIINNSYNIVTQNLKFSNHLEKLYNFINK